MNFLKRLFCHLSRLWSFLPNQGKAASTGCKSALRLKASIQAPGAVQAVTPLVLWLNFSLLWCYSWLLGLLTSLILVESRLSGSVWTSMVCWDSGHKYFEMYSTILMKNSHIRYYPSFAIEKPRFVPYLQEGEKCIRYWVIKQEVIIGWDLGWQAMY